MPRGRAPLTLPLACSLLLAALAGCSGNPAQSAIHPAGPAAAKIAVLWWVMCGAFVAVQVLVTLLALWSIYRRRTEHGVMPPLGKTGFIVAGGIILPLVVVVPLFVYSLETSARLAPGEPAETIRVVGYQWWWEVEYPEHGNVTANELYIPVGKPVRLELLAADVIHSFWVPSLHGKRDMIPGLENEFWIQADEPGVYRGQCAEYCGTQHANMAFLVIALPAEEYAEWLASQQPTPPPPTTEALQRGQAVFFRAGCAKCHRIAGTAANGQAGPDLTHIGSRQTLGAGTLKNNTGNLAGWIADAPSNKPGVKMPRTYLEPDELFDLVAYLESLK